MKIEGTKLHTEKKLSKLRKKSSSSSVFSVDDEGDVGACGSVEKASGGSEVDQLNTVSGIDPSVLVTLQSSDAVDDYARCKHFVDKGKLALEELSVLQKELLSGGAVNASRLLEMDKDMPDISDISDPELKEIYSFIKQRLRIELAKLGL